MMTLVSSQAAASSANGQVISVNATKMLVGWKIISKNSGVTATETKLKITAATFNTVLRALIVKSLIHMLTDSNAFDIYLFISKTNKQLLNLDILLQLHYRSLCP